MRWRGQWRTATPTSNAGAREDGRGADGRGGRHLWRHDDWRSCLEVRRSGAGEGCHQLQAWYLYRVVRRNGRPHEVVGCNHGGRWRHGRVAGEGLWRGRSHLLLFLLLLWRQRIGHDGRGQDWLRRRGRPSVLTGKLKLRTRSTGQQRYGGPSCSRSGSAGRQRLLLGVLRSLQRRLSPSSIGILQGRGVVFRFV